MSGQGGGANQAEPWRKVLAEIELPWGPALWVLAAHVLTLFAPMTVLWAVHTHADFLAQKVHSPVFFYVGVGVLMAGSSFEFAQNTIDRWYLTPETASAEGHALCDLLFYTFIALGMGAFAYAAAGDLWFVPVLSLSGAAAFVYLYLRGRVPYGALALAGWTMTLALFWKLRDPVLFLQPICGTGMTRYFFATLLRTNHQPLHGLTTLGNGIGMLAIPWAVAAGAAGQPTGWGTTAAVLGVCAVLAIALWKPLMRLSATERRLGGPLVAPAAGPLPDPAPDRA